MKIAILATDGFEGSELFVPRAVLRDAGYDTEIISPDAGIIIAWKDHEWGREIAVDRALEDANSDHYDALMLPGGVLNADSIRTNKTAVEFVKGFVNAHKPIAAICHGSWILIEADAIQGKTLTSWPSLKTDLTNAGAHWVDEQVVEDDGLVTSRNPGDLQAFCKTMIQEFKKASEPKPTMFYPFRPFKRPKSSTGLRGVRGNE